MSKTRSPGSLRIGDRVRETEVWKSVFRPGSIYRRGYKDTSRDRALATMNNVLYHLHPTKVKRHGLKLTYTFCLGGLSFFLFILLTLTGIFLMFFSYWMWAFMRPRFLVPRHLRGQRGWVAATLHAWRNDRASRRERRQQVGSRSGGDHAQR